MRQPHHLITEVLRYGTHWQNKPPEPLPSKPKLILAYRPLCIYVTKKQLYQNNKEYMNIGPCERWWQVLDDSVWSWDMTCSRRTVRQRTAETQRGSLCPVQQQTPDANINSHRHIVESSKYDFTSHLTHCRLLQRQITVPRQIRKTKPNTLQSRD